MTGSDILTYGLGLLLGSLGGAVATMVAMRTRLAMMARDRLDTDSRVTRLEEKLEAKIDHMERRQLMQLRIVADVARKVGADARWDDAVLRFLADEEAA